MPHPSPRTATARKRMPHQASEGLGLTWVEPTLTPMLTPEQVAAANAADLARPPRAPYAHRPTHQCTVGYGYYAASDARVPTLRLRGRWLEQLGFAIGSKLHVAARDGELVVTVVRDG
jgi:toxic protein SymE